MYNIDSLCVTPFQQNCRILSDPATQTSVVIDPGGEAKRILKFLEQKNLKCQHIWLTHSHLDHCGGVKELLDSTGAILSAHPGESVMRSSVIDISKMYGLPTTDLQNCPEPTQQLKGGETISFEGYEFEVLFTPGHSPGHLSFYDSQNGILLSGDVLFAGSVGRTDLPGGDHRTLMNTIAQLAKSLPPETKILCGHGPDTTLAVEIATNPFLIRN